ncbi:hypothetical protein B0O99DRAFT_626641 [Bisporella sp. PMI_857]|nr:hypothetical protein B0O99DRAFT_626641 [Bisporella sp. PMI_857]
MPDMENLSSAASSLGDRYLARQLASTNNQSAATVPYDAHRTFTSSKSSKSKQQPISDAASTFSTSTTATEKPLLKSSSSDKKSSKAWEKTKKFLSTTKTNSVAVGEDPTRIYIKQENERRKAQGLPPMPEPWPMMTFGAGSYNDRPMAGRI